MLASKHALDVYVPECKDGPSQTRAHRRLDAWVMLKTWSPITTIGYEIKVDRGDWRRDNKLHDYMPLCHLLYVVAPKGVVPVEELPSGVGLIVPVGTSGRLQTLRKAARREIELPAELMVYVLMCRTRVTREHSDDSPNDRNWRTEHLRAWVEAKESREKLSYLVSQKIRHAFERQQCELEEERRRNNDLEDVRKRITELGFDVTRRVSTWQVKDKLNAFNRIVDTHTLREMRSVGDKMKTLADTLERVKQGRGEDEEVA